MLVTEFMESGDLFRALQKKVMQGRDKWYAFHSKNWVGAVPALHPHVVKELRLPKRSVERQRLYPSLAGFAGQNVATALL